MATKIKRSILIKKLDTIFSQYIRRRYALNNISECFTCGVKNEYKKQQAGHFASRRHYSTRWNEFNVQVQCYSCNICQQGMQFEFGKRLCLQYGDNFAEDLMIESKKVVKFADVDLEDMIEYYNTKILALESKEN
jgi:hypothetical protein